MSLEQYDKLLALQGGECYGRCGARGITSNLHVDHSHGKAKAECSHPHQESCSNCWRGLLCSNCNSTLSRCRDNVDVLLRLVGFLQVPPAQRWIAAGLLELDDELDQAA